MAINFGAEYKRFEKEMAKKHELYAQLGMSQEQIDALDEFDKEEFLSDNTYKRHVQSLSIDEDSENPEDLHPLFKKFGDVLSVELKVTFRDKYAWLDEISSPELTRKLLSLAPEDLELLDAYPLTSRIRCSECGSVFRRKVRNGAIKWVCARHSADTHACPSGYYSEERIYDGFITMVNKLRFGEERILDQVIAKLETAAALYKRNNISAGKMSQSIAELNAKLVMLEQLRSKVFI